MRLKPRNTTLNKRALLYRRYTNTEAAFAESQTLDKIFDVPIAKYQTNKYYYVLSFDYMHTGSVEGNTTQPIRGMIAPLGTLTIKYYDDSVRLCTDDLVVIDGRLYSVESVTVDMKHQPRTYYIYTADLNSIL